MRTLAFDTETYLITEGNIIPKMVCLSNSDGDLFSRDDGCEWFDANLGVNLLVGHNVYFDLAVCYEAYKDLLPNLLLRIFHAIDNGLVSCTKTRAKMYAVATGNLKFIKGVKRSFSLAACVANRFDVALDGKVAVVGEEDPWRLRYSELDNISIVDWPLAARKYAIDDSIWTLKLYQSQGGYPMHQEVSQIQGAWGLYLTSAYGLRTDPAAVNALEKRLRAEFLESREIAYEEGLIKKKIKKKSGAVSYSKHMASVRERILSSTPEDQSVRKTDGGAVSTASDIIRGLAVDKDFNIQLPKCDRLEENQDNYNHPAIRDKGLYALSRMVKVEKLLKTYVPVLKTGTDIAICTHYDSIQETYRSSAAHPNVQNLPRGGGVRECFVPRAGRLFAFCDYDTLELRSLTQVNIDLKHNPDMLRALQEGQDLHLAFAASMLGISYTEAVTRKKAGDAEIKAYRQYAKCANFGIPGGMGAASFVQYCKGMGVTISVGFASDLKRKFLRMWSEMRAYFKHCSDIMQGADTAKVTFVRSGLKRDKVRYCAVCNGFFQHLAAMGAKNALYQVVKECYINTVSPLYGCRPVLFLHDEIGLEIPDDKLVNERVERLQEVMISAMTEWIPDVPITCGPVVTRAWFKGAEPVYVDGKIVPCKPQGDVWIHDKGLDSPPVVGYDTKHG